MYSGYCAADPFAALESVAPPPAAPAAALNLVDLDDLYGTATPVPPPPQVLVSQAATFSSLPTQGQGHQISGSSSQLPQMANAKAAAPQHKPAPVPGAPAPMAPRGNAAVELQAGQKDPFADLFS